MRFCTSRIVRRDGRHEQSGFTLVEVLTALGVLSVATFIAVRLFTASYDLSHTNNQQLIAEELANGVVTQIVTDRDEFEWPKIADLGVNEFALVDAKQSPGLLIDSPAVTPTLARKAQSERDLYEKFTWSAYVSRPSSDARYVDLTVVIRWRTNMRPQSFALTTAVARNDIPGQETTE